MAGTLIHLLLVGALVLLVINLVAAGVWRKAVDRAFEDAK